MTTLTNQLSESLSDEEEESNDGDMDNSEVIEVSLSRDTAGGSRRESSPKGLVEEDYALLLQEGLEVHPSPLELVRDSVLRFLDHPAMQLLGVLVVLGILVDGALFFFLLVGWHRMCDTPSKYDCDPRNGWYNLSIQILNVFISYMNLCSFPWRCSNFFHITQLSCSARFCPRRSNTLGCGLYGVPDDPDIWFHIPLRQRLCITCILLLNNVMQFVNHSMRIRYRTYDLQNTWPGNLLTSCFFITSFSCGGIGASWMLYEMGKLRKENPEQFGLGPIDTLKLKWNDYKERKNGDNNTGGTTRRMPLKKNSDHLSSNDEYPEFGGEEIELPSAPDIEGEFRDEDPPSFHDELKVNNTDDDDEEEESHQSSLRCRRSRAGSIDHPTNDNKLPPPPNRPRRNTLAGMDVDLELNHNNKHPTESAHQVSFEDEPVSDHSRSTSSTHNRRHSLPRGRYPDPTRDPLHRHIIGEGKERGGLRMFAM